MNAELDYELIDFGAGRKLERFGKYVLDRPDVLADSPPNVDSSDWKALADATFIETQGSAGIWDRAEEISAEWLCGLSLPSLNLEIALSLRDYKHVGIFPEQVEHWEMFARNVRAGDRLLNLFAYTGVASMVAAAKGADVFHVDSSRSIMKVAKRNAELNGLNTIHWVVEDALKFVNREANRGNKYDHILLDPPVFGRGTKGEIWKLEIQLPQLLELCAKILSPEGRLTLNTYSPKLSLSGQRQIVQSAGFLVQDEGTLEIVSRSGSILELSNFLHAGLLNRA